MSPAELAVAIFALLVTPGPTNTLLAVAGAERGWARAVRLVPAELAGYLASTLPLAVLGSRLLDRLPEARAALTAAAAAWVLWLALALWRAPVRAAGAVTARRVAVTTFLNPKGLVFGLALLPAADWGRLLFNFGQFVVQVAVVAALWAALGAALRRGGRDALIPPLRRAAALWLGALALWLAGHAAGLA